MRDKGDLASQWERVLGADKIIQGFKKKPCRVRISISGAINKGMCEKTRTTGLF